MMKIAYLLLIYLITYGAPSILAQVTHNVQCGPTDTSCECNANASVCVFQLHIENVFTFTRYNSSGNLDQGEIIHINTEGDFVPFSGSETCSGEYVKFTSYNGTNTNGYCIKKDEVINNIIKKCQLCSDPITIDGRTYKLVLAVNKQFPGPTLIVHEGQTIAVDVHNNLSSETISIHWHGQHQMKTNYMDGVGLVTQCPIQPGSSFRYIFTAKPSGTFWYHSHMGSQRSNGIFGALIVKERHLKYPLSFIDNPATHTITLMDWYRQDFEEFFRSDRFGVGLYPNLSPFTIPSETTYSFHGTVGPDFTSFGKRPYWAGLIHGKGRHHSVSYEQSSLKVYEVEKNKGYRFRLIHTGIQYAFMFSIDGHKLTVIATDGYLVEPVEVDYIALHTAERYDFILHANQDRGDYWIKANTFEVDVGNISALPFSFYDHSAEAILHYSGSEKPHPSQYRDIPRLSKQCTQEAPCKMLNCPMGDFHSSYNIECISVDNLRLVTSTPESEMPDETPDVTYFMNMAGFAGRNKPISSINDKLFKFPSYPLTTHYEKNDENAFCDLQSTCDIETGCSCTTVMDLKYNVTVRVVMSTVGIERNDIHSMHIHGHSVHVLKIGYGEYSTENGSLIASSRDLTCTDEGDDLDTLDHNRCPSPRFRSPHPTYPLDSHTVRKDTIILPSGGYVVIQFRSNNPGFWLFHCHVELHQHEGMMMVIREAVNKIDSPPKEMETCNTFIWDIDDFMLAKDGDNGSFQVQMSTLLLLVAILLIMYVHV